MIQKLLNRNRRVAEDIVRVQRQGYAIEARLIGLRTLPPQRESPAEIQRSCDTFYGCLESGILVGIISCEHKPDGESTITRLAVDPVFFRRRIASRLLTRMISEIRRAGKSAVCVSTGRRNAPALRLYRKFGFTPLKRLRTRDGVELQTFRLDLCGGLGAAWAPRRSKGFGD